MTSVREQIDFNYIFAHCDQTKYEIPHYYDRQLWNTSETYRIRVGHIYDPSKFWIVMKDRELDVLQMFLTNFYKKRGDCYKIDPNRIGKSIYCVANINDSFYRGLIVNVPHTSTLEKKTVVFLFDFGYMASVNLENLYYLCEKLYEVPQFAVRASLSSVQPYKKMIWDYNVVKRFNELVSGKVLLCILECTDPRRRIVEIALGDVKELSSVIDIGDILINEKLAQSIVLKKKSAKEGKSNNSRYISTTKYPYLFPTFEAIESGLVPSSICISEMLKQCIASDVLFRPYFAYSGIVAD